MRIGLAGAGRIGAFHAATLDGLPSVEVIVADVRPEGARALAARLGSVRPAETVDDLFASDLDGLVVAAATGAHAGLVTRAVDAGLPVFCEKPLASDIDGTFQIMTAARRAGVPVQVGFQRRFDSGHLAARDAVASGRLGWIHTLNSATLDPAPPPREYIARSGGLFRDCVIHDVDAIRFVTGREIVRVNATGANKGDAYFRESGDVDTAAAVLTLDDDTLALVSATRYNGAGYDVRLEVHGSKDSIVAGQDARTPLTAVPAHDGPAVPYGGFMERFAAAYTAELSAFSRLVEGRAESACTPEEALEAFYVVEACEISRREGRAVELAEVRR
ncbi:Gfo/Idh/MocA family protein [Spirillospora sp. CA-294931]|uniref:Gfo/Idh/MocA family protein n=1 Tax=Spirillospora sp. CA-294931 TaxID=3240042 RepID=UPI003D8D78EB